MLFITGPHGVGKTHFAKVLQQDGFPSIDLGPTLRMVWNRTSPHITFEEFIRRGEEIGNTFLDQLLVKEIITRLNLKEPGSYKDLLVVGSRSISGIQYLKSNFPELRSIRSVVVYIDAEEEILYRRYCRRENRQVEVEEFRQLLDEDREMGLEEIRQVADFLIENNGSLKEFNREIKDFQDQLYREDQNNTSRLERETQ